MSTNEIDRRENFHIAVEAIFKNWTALQMAVKQGSAGPQSQAIASWLVEATVQWFSENKNLEVTGYFIPSLNIMIALLFRYFVAVSKF